MASRAGRQGAARPKRGSSDGHQKQRAEAEGRDGAYHMSGRQEGIEGFSAGKRQVMEKFFTPVQVASQDELKLRKHRHQPPQHQHQDREMHSYSMLDEDDRSTVDSHGHRHQHHHNPHLHDNHMHHPHPNQYHPHHHHHSPEHLHRGEGDMNDHHTSVTLSRASSSSLSSTSSSSSCWSTEASTNDPFSLKLASRPQHSLSCSNIMEARGKFSEDDISEPIVYATIKHGRPKRSSLGGHGEAHSRPQGHLDRALSRSEEGLLLKNQSSKRGRGSQRPLHLEHGTLYKTASLGRSLAFSEDEGPKRAVSSMQLPTKGILKNRAARPDIRKAKSMEVLSPRVQGGGTEGGGGKGPHQVETARKNFVQGKMQFSAFLDEITRQVISPSRLNTLGVNTLKTPGQAQAPAPAQAATKTQPQLPPKTNRRVSLEEKPVSAKHQPASVKPSNDMRLRKDSVTETRFPVGKNHAQPASPPPQPHHTAGRKQRHFVPESALGEGQGQYGPLLTDCTSTSTESTQNRPKQRHHKQRSQRPCHSPPALTSQSGRPPSPSGPGQEYESPSSKSDSSRNRDTASTVSASSEKSDRQYRGTHRGGPKQHKASVDDIDQVQALQEENMDLHQNLLQTVVCIESLEGELQKTREELSHVKEKYKRLQDSLTGTQHTNNFLGEKLNTAVPSLIKELIEKHLKAPEAVQKFLQAATPTNQSTPAHKPDVQSAPLNVEGMSHDWSGGGQRQSEVVQQRVTAFLPWKQEGSGGEEGGIRVNSAPNSHELPFSVADISLAIYRKVAANHAELRPVLPQTCHPSVVMDDHGDCPPNPYPLAGVKGREVFGGKVRAAEVEQVNLDMSYLSAQRILDDFMYQLTIPEEEDGKRQDCDGGDCNL
ncbi:histone-lysine N-methyltransferase, H3 lysine-79 specific isoform X2 [Osmerus eperlanus]|uniref:histone-lysine N-methyltransferase, H3 lysine-79 specific isoform X2 n=1 Tax=Osmerus eperlanus TaxID=29151 RepID=UPI002E168887